MCLLLFVVYVVFGGDVADHVDVDVDIVINCRGINSCVDVDVGDEV